MGNHPARVKLKDETLRKHGSMTLGILKIDFPWEPPGTHMHMCMCVTIQGTHTGNFRGLLLRMS